jgi:hypothetical protein
VVRFQIVVSVGRPRKRLTDEGFEGRLIDDEVLPRFIDQHLAAIQIDEAEGQEAIVGLAPPKVILAEELYVSHCPLHGALLNHGHQGERQKLVDQVRLRRFGGRLYGHVDVRGAQFLNVNGADVRQPLRCRQ